MKAASEGLRDISFELGGKNAALVFDDVDLEKAMDGVAPFNLHQLWSSLSLHRTCVRS